MYEQWIEEKIGHLKRKNEHVTMVGKSITGNIYPKMRDAIATSEIITLANHMRALIRLPDNALVPVNAITFIIAGSGTSKDRSLNSARGCFKSIYKKMEAYLEMQAIKTAKATALENGKKGENDWRLFYRAARPIFGGSEPTISGVAAHMNDMQSSNAGGGHIYSGEFGAELSNSNNMLDVLKFASEIYDMGNMKTNFRKTTEAQGKEIKSMNFSALFISSPNNIIYDQTVKKKFIIEFTSRLARRSFFNFNQNSLPKLNETVEQLILREKRELKESMEAIYEMQEVTDKLTPKIKNIFSLEEGLWEIYGVVKQQYEIKAERIDPELESFKLATAHTQWRALKLAGAYTQLDNRTEVSIKDFAEALHYCETIEEDLKEFNVELNKESYELLDDYVNSVYNDEAVELTAHRLSKLGYIDNVKAVKTKLRDIADMANDISEGIYTADGTKIVYEKLISKDVVGASYMTVTGEKAERTKQCHEGYEYKEVGFERVANLMRNDTAYCMFEFSEGKRSNANIKSGTKWLCLDIDNSTITDEECHDMLSDFKHHICRTSNSTNPFKFRVAIELDKYIDPENKIWKKFVESVASYLALDVDILPKSQIFFGYKGRNVLTNMNGDLVEVKEHLVKATSEESKKHIPTTKEAKEMLEDQYETFFYAYESKKGTRSTTLIRAVKHAKDLGASMEELIHLVDDINNYWSDPMEEARLETTIKSQIRRMF